MRSKIITFASIDMPTVRISPAIPGKVRVAWSEASIAKTRIRFQIRAKSAIPVSYTHLTLPTTPYV